MPVVRQQEGVLYPGVQTSARSLCFFPGNPNVRELVNGQAHYSRYYASDGCVSVGCSISVHTSRGSHAGLPLASEHPSRNASEKRADPAATAQEGGPAKRCCEPHEVI